MFVLFSNIVLFSNSAVVVLFSNSAVVDINGVLDSVLTVVILGSGLLSDCVKSDNTKYIAKMSKLFHTITDIVCQKYNYYYCYNQITNYSCFELPLNFTFSSVSAFLV